MYKLLEHIIHEQQLEEFNAKQLAGSLALAGTLALAQPNVAGAMNLNPFQCSDVVKQDININKLLSAIKNVESTNGKNTKTRYEPKVERHLRNKFNTLKPAVQEAIKRFGFKRMATSYGPYQILASTAFDIGFQGDPEGLAEEDTNTFFCKKLLGTFIKNHRTHTLEDVISAYNAGLGRIGKNPDYVKKVTNYYNHK